MLSRLGPPKRARKSAVAEHFQPWSFAEQLPGGQFPIRALQQAGHPLDRPAQFRAVVGDPETPVIDQPARAGNDVTQPDPVGPSAATGIPPAIPDITTWPTW